MGAPWKPIEYGKLFGSYFHFTSMFSSSSLNVHVVYFDQLICTAHLFVCLSKYFFYIFGGAKISFQEMINGEDQEESCDRQG